MTDTQLTWMGIVSQAIPTITAILMVTVGNWKIKSNERIKYIKGDVFIDKLPWIELEPIITDNVITIKKP